MNNELYHYGVLGMKWGIRRNRSKLPQNKRQKSMASEDSRKVSNIRKKSIDQMSNQELRDANNRLQLERQYKDLTKKTNVGKKAVDTFIRTAGTITAVAAAAKVYQKLGTGALDKIGNFVVNSIDVASPWTD